MGGILSIENWYKGKWNKEGNKKTAIYLGWSPYTIDCLSKIQLINYNEIIVFTSDSTYLLVVLGLFRSMPKEFPAP